MNQYETIQNNITKYLKNPKGINLVGGFVGSGKTTLLCDLLQNDFKDDICLISFWGESLYKTQKRSYEISKEIDFPLSLVPQKIIKIEELCQSDKQIELIYSALNLNKTIFASLHSSNVLNSYERIKYLLYCNEIISDKFINNEINYCVNTYLATYYNEILVPLKACNNNQNYKSILDILIKYYPNMNMDNILTIDESKSNLKNNYKHFLITEEVLFDESFKKVLLTENKKSIKDYYHKYFYLNNLSIYINNEKHNLIEKILNGVIPIDFLKRYIH